MLNNHNTTITIVEYTEYRLHYIDSVVPPDKFIHRVEKKKRDATKEKARKRLQQSLMGTDSTRLSCLRFCLPYTETEFDDRTVGATGGSMLIGAIQVIQIGFDICF